MRVLISTLICLLSASCSKDSSFTSTNKSKNKSPESISSGATTPSDIGDQDEERYFYKSFSIISDPPRKHGLSVATSSEKLDLTTFKEKTYTNTAGGAQSDWEVLDSGDKIVQHANSHATLYYGDIVHKNFETEGYWQTLSSSDDDFMGFGFAIQNENEFYLFQWKKYDQYEAGCKAKKGMQVRKMSLGGSHNRCDFWGSSGTNKAEILFHNDVPWEHQKEYKFRLVFRPGKFLIEIKEATTAEVIASFTVEDDSYKSGKFGFYNYSQPKIAYRGFSISPLPSEVYKYRVETDAEKGTKVKYELKESPKGMVIDKATGLISWQVDEAAEGKYDVVVIAEDESGNLAKQKYTLELTK